MTLKIFPQPRVISKICEILCDNNQLSVISRGGIVNMDNSYYCNASEELKKDIGFQIIHNKRLSYIVYGFKYIYDDYKKYVLPIEFTDFNDKKSLGTCFIYRNGIATARHCIEGAKKISIQGVPKTNLEKAKFEVHENSYMDLLFIRLDEPIIDSIFFSENAELLDEIMTMGYPKIAGFHNFLTTENATVSSRFTASVGQIASNSQDIWMREKLFLITAKIKGGNSGGPIVNKSGAVIGVTVNLSQGEGDYDELGYGTVIPISFLDELTLTENKNYLEVSKIEFSEFD